MKIIEWNSTNIPQIISLIKPAFQYNYFEKIGHEFLIQLDKFDVSRKNVLLKITLYFDNLDRINLFYTMGYKALPFYSCYFEPISQVVLFEGTKNIVICAFVTEDFQVLSINKHGECAFRKYYEAEWQERIKFWEKHDA